MTTETITRGDWVTCDDERESHLYNVMCVNPVRAAKPGLDGSSQPAQGAGGEWSVHKCKREIVNERGFYVAFTTDE